MFAAITCMCFWLKKWFGSGFTGIIELQDFYFYIVLKKFTLFNANPATCLRKILVKVPAINN